MARVRGVVERREPKLVARGDAGASAEEQPERLDGIARLYLNGGVGTRGPPLTWPKPRCVGLVQRIKKLVTR